MNDDGFVYDIVFGIVVYCPQAGFKVHRAFAIGIELYVAQVAGMKAAAVPLAMIGIGWIPVGASLFSHIATNTMLVDVNGYNLTGFRGNSDLQFHFYFAILTLLKVGGPIHCCIQLCCPDDSRCLPGKVCADLTGVATS